MQRSTIDGLRSGGNAQIDDHMHIPGATASGSRINGNNTVIDNTCASNTNTNNQSSNNSFNSNSSNSGNNNINCSSNNNTVSNSVNYNSISTCSADNSTNCSIGSVCATVAFMDIKSASKAHTAEHKFDDRLLTTEYYEPSSIPSTSGENSPSSNSSLANAQQQTTLSAAVQREQQSPLFSVRNDLHLTSTGSAVVSSSMTSQPYVSSTVPPSSVTHRLTATNHG